VTSRPPQPRRFGSARLACFVRLPPLLIFKSAGKSLLLLLLASLGCQKPQPSPNHLRVIPKKVDPAPIPSQVKIIGLGQFPNDEIPKEWSRQKLTIFEAEKKHLYKIQELGPDPIPFGYLNPQWEAFKQMIRPGDELLEVSFSEAPLSGSSGLCILRNNKVVISLLLSMN